jgi:hypothetical protein
MILTDEEIAIKANAMIAADKYTTENAICKRTGCTKYKLQQLIKAGQIKPLVKLSRSALASMSRKKNDTYKGWTIGARA